MSVQDLLVSLYISSGTPYLCTRPLSVPMHPLWYTPMSAQVLLAYPYIFFGLFLVCYTLLYMDIARRALPAIATLPQPHHRLNAINFPSTIHRAYYPKFPPLPQPPPQYHHPTYSHSLFDWRLRHPCRRFPSEKFFNLATP
jgi:hypothetical protein